MCVCVCVCFSFFLLLLHFDRCGGLCRSYLRPICDDRNNEQKAKSAHIGSLFLISIETRDDDRCSAWPVLSVRGTYVVLSFGKEDLMGSSLDPPVATARASITNRCPLLTAWPTLFAGSLPYRFGCDPPTPLYICTWHFSLGLLGQSSRPSPQTSRTTPT